MKIVIKHMDVILSDILKCQLYIDDLWDNSPDVTQQRQWKNCWLRNFNSSTITQISFEA